MENKLEHLEGLKFNYRGENIIIQKTKVVQGNQVIITNRRTFNLLPSEIDEFELSLEPYKEIQVKDVSSNINDILFETIERVRADKGYVQQANTICNVVSQMINIKKVELLINKNK